MHVFYTPDMKIDHVVFDAPEDYADNMRKMGITNFVTHPEHLKIEEIEILPDLTIRQRAPMNLIFQPKLKLGEMVRIEGVPANATLVFENQAETIDDSGLIEFEPTIAGFYRLQFSAPGFISKEIEIEIEP